MELRDTEGTRFLMLEPASYQFAEARGESYDDNWLVVNGKVRSDLEQWKFQDPCLLVWEAQALGAWLTSVADGEARMMSADSDGYLWPTTEHTEPNVGLGLVKYGPHVVTIRAFLWLESGPPSVAELADSQMEWFMDLDVTREGLRIAAAVWAAELELFPQRT